MKKIITVLALAAFFGGISLQASPVSPEKALDIARKIFDAQNGKRASSGDISIVWNGEFDADAAKRDAVQPAFYVVAREGGGWVMVAGDDNVRPVLGLSADGLFESENMPDNVKWWMERIKAYVRSTAAPDPEVSELWTKFVDTKADARVPAGDVTLLIDRKTPDWGQGTPYNAFCPKKSGETCITGCVPTAIAELLTYESGQEGVTVPTHGTGTVGGYAAQGNYVTPNPSFSLDDRFYDWDNLRTLTNRSAAMNASDELKQNLARLIADIGAAVEAQYGVNGTSTMTGQITISHMIDHFGINKAATWKQAESFSPHQWTEMLKSELALRPILYSGRTLEDEGHSFLLDGYGTYDGYDVFRVNFGWNGTDNGFYYITNLDTERNGNWSFECSAFFGFYPDADSVYPVDLVAKYIDDDESYPGVRLQKHPNLPDYYAIYYSILNAGQSDYDGQVKFRLLKRDGTEVDIDGAVQNYSVPSMYYSYRWFGYYRLDSIDFGDRVVCYYKVDDEWRLLESPDYSAISEWPMMPAAFIYTESEYSVGDYYTFRLKNHSRIFKGTTWRFIDPDGIATTLPQSAKEFQFTKVGKYKIEAAVAETVGGPVVETIVTYITVGNN